MRIARSLSEISLKSFRAVVGAKSIFGLGGIGRPFQPLARYQTSFPGACRIGNVAPNSRRFSASRLSAAANRCVTGTGRDARRRDATRQQRALLTSATGAAHRPGTREDTSDGVRRAPSTSRRSCHEACNHCRRYSGRSCRSRMRAGCAGCRCHEACSRATCRCHAGGQCALCRSLFGGLMQGPHRVPVDCRSQARGWHLRDRILPGRAITLRDGLGMEEPRRVLPVKPDGSTPEG